MLYKKTTYPLTSFFSSIIIFYIFILDPHNTWNDCCCKKLHYLKYKFTFILSKKTVVMKKILSTIMLLLVAFAGTALATPIQGGLQGEYYNGSNGNAPVFNDLKFTQIDSTVDFDWGGGSPDFEKLGKNDYSIKWTGWINIETVGTYDFGLNSDDSSMLYIGGQTVVDNGGNHRARLRTGSMTFDDIGLYALELTYHERGGRSNVSLLWDIGSAVAANNYQVIGSDYLYYDDGRTSPSPTPEPTTMVLFGFGLLGVAGMMRRKKSLNTNSL